MLTRRNWPAVIVVVLVIAAFLPMGLHAYRSWQHHSTQQSELALDVPLPDKVPPGTSLIIGDPITQRVLQYTGWDKQLPFKVEWANISGGPQVTEAFHAKAIDLGSAANIPPINAVYVGIPVKIIAVRLRQDPLRHPTYVLGISPASKVRTLADLRGKRIAFSRGQAQGLVVLRALKEAGLSPSDVTLVDLPTTGDVYPEALGANAVDVAPLGAGLPADRYLANYARDGARVIDHGAFRDDPGILYVREETLKDPAKAAALREYVRYWARAIEWVQTHRSEWIRTFYVKNQGVSEADARRVVAAAGTPDVPRDWGAMIDYQQSTIDLLAKETGNTRFPAATLFDRRFQAVAADAIDQTRRNPQLLAQR